MAWTDCGHVQVATSCSAAACSAAARQPGCRAESAARRQVQDCASESHVWRQERDAPAGTAGMRCRQAAQKSAGVSRSARAPAFQRTLPRLSAARDAAAPPPMHAAGPRRGPRAQPALRSAAAAAGSLPSAAACGARGGGAGQQAIMASRGGCAFQSGQPGLAARSPGTDIRHAGARTRSRAGRTSLSSRARDKISCRSACSRRCLATSFFRVRSYSANTITAPTWGEGETGRGSMQRLRGTARGSCHLFGWPSGSPTVSRAAAQTRFVANTPPAGTQRQRALERGLRGASRRPPPAHHKHEALARHLGGQLDAFLLRHRAYERLALLALGPPSDGDLEAVRILPCGQRRRGAEEGRSGRDVQGGWVA